MYAIVFKTIITFLAVYAVLDIVIRIGDIFFDGGKDSSERVFIVVKVLNREKNLEYIIRGIIWKALNNAKGGNLPNVLIVDMGSDDETSTIAKKLAHDYSFIYYTDNADFDEVKKTFNID